MTTNHDISRFSRAPSEVARRQHLNAFELPRTVFLYYNQETFRVVCWCIGHQIWEVEPVILNTLLEECNFLGAPVIVVVSHSYIHVHRDTYQPGRTVFGEIIFCATALGVESGCISVPLP